MSTIFWSLILFGGPVLLGVMVYYLIGRAFNGSPKQQQAYAEWFDSLTPQQQQIELQQRQYAATRAIGGLVIWNTITGAQHDHQPFGPADGHPNP